jgi:hypothetical protein
MSCYMPVRVCCACCMRESAREHVCRAAKNTILLLTMRRKERRKIHLHSMLHTRSSPSSTSTSFYRASYPPSYLTLAGGRHDMSRWDRRRRKKTEDGRGRNPPLDLVSCHRSQCLLLALPTPRCSFALHLRPIRLATTSLTRSCGISMYAHHLSRLAASLAAAATSTWL